MALTIPLRLVPGSQSTTQRSDGSWQRVETWTCPQAYADTAITTTFAKGTLAAGSSAPLGWMVLEAKYGKKVGEADREIIVVWEKFDART